MSEKIVDKAIQFIAEIKKQNPKKGTNTHVLFYVALYIAFRKNGVPKTLKEIAELGNINTNVLSRNYRMIVIEMNVRMPRIRPEVWVKDKIKHFPEKILNKSMELARNLDNLFSTQGKAPSSIAAVAVYKVCNQERYIITQKMISNLFNVSTVTIRKLSRVLR